MTNAFYDVCPRYGGTPAKVDRHIAMKVAQDEAECHRHALAGVYGEAEQAKAKRWGLRGISQQMIECHHAGRKGWMMIDLITGENYLIPFAEKMRKDGWVTWDELPDHYKTEFADQEPPLTDRRYWFKPEFGRDREGNIGWTLMQWQPEIEYIDDNRSLS